MTPKIRSATWTQTQIKQMTALFNLGLSDEDIGRKTGRTRESVKAKRIALGLLRRRSLAKTTRGRVLMLRRTGLASAEIAERVGISVTAVCRILAEHDKLPEAEQVASGVKMRPCLGPLCKGKRSFLSDSPGNRICPRCREYRDQFNLDLVA
jgi:hypothetical protein